MGAGRGRLFWLGWLVLLVGGCCASDDERAVLQVAEPFPAEVVARCGLRLEGGLLSDSAGDLRRGCELYLRVDNAAELRAFGYRDEDRSRVPVGLVGHASPRLLAYTFDNARWRVVFVGQGDALFFSPLLLEAGAEGPTLASVGFLSGRAVELYPTSTHEERALILGLVSDEPEGAAKVKALLLATFDAAGADESTGSAPLEPAWAAAWRRLPEGAQREVRDALRTHVLSDAVTPQAMARYLLIEGERRAAEDAALRAAIWRLAPKLGRAPLDEALLLSLLLGDGFGAHDEAAQLGCALLGLEDRERPWTLTKIQHAALSALSRASAPCPAWDAWFERTACTPEALADFEAGPLSAELKAKQDALRTTVPVRYGVGFDLEDEVARTLHPDLYYFSVSDAAVFAWRLRAETPPRPDLYRRFGRLDYARTGECASTSPDHPCRCTFQEWAAPLCALKLDQTTLTTERCTIAIDDDAGRLTFSAAGTE